MGDFDLLDIFLNQIGQGQPSSIPENNIQDFYELNDPFCGCIKRFRTEGHTFSLKQKNLDHANITTVGSQVFTAVLDKVTAKMVQTSLIVLVFASSTHHLNDLFLFHFGGDKISLGMLL